MNDINVAICGIRALLFACAFCSACVFMGEVHSSFDIICSIIKGKVRSTQIIGLAAFGWFGLAISSLILTGHSIWNIIQGHFDITLRFGWDAFWIMTGLGGMSIGFYIPVLAILWYRNKLPTAIIIGAICPSIGLVFAGLMRHHLGAY